MLTIRQLSAFLKSDQARAAPSETTAQEATDAMKRTEETIRKGQAQLVQQGQTLSGFTIVTTAFLPLGFCASVLLPPYLHLSYEYFLTGGSISILA